MGHSVVNGRMLSSRDGSGLGRIQILDRDRGSYSDLLETLVVRRNGRSCWSRGVCAQGRRSNQLSYAPNRLSDDFHVLPVLLGACQALRVTGQLLDIA